MQTRLLTTIIVWLFSIKASAQITTPSTPAPRQWQPHGIGYSQPPQQRNLTPATEAERRQQENNQRIIQQTQQENYNRQVNTALGQYGQQQPTRLQLMDEFFGMAQPNAPKLYIPVVPKGVATLPADVQADLAELKREEQQQKAAKVHSSYIENARHITAMLEGRAPLSLKGAVFLAENAHYGNSMTFEEWNENIYWMATAVATGIQEKGYQTPRSRSFAVADFLLNPVQLADKNGKVVYHHPALQYDFTDYWGDHDITKQFVTKLMKTNTGQCHSMPLLFRILAEEVQAEAYLSFAPNHSFIRHRDDAGRWYNLELTSGHYFDAQELFTAQGLVNPVAIQSGIYLDTMNLHHTVAYCLTDLAQYYAAEFGYNSFTLECAELVLQYYPHDLQALMLRANSYMYAYRQAQKQAGNPPNDQLARYPALQALYQKVAAYREELSTLGYEYTSRESYDQWTGSLRTEAQKQKSSQLQPPTKSNTH